ncbi:MAG TPA: sigma 54-interacting transcriptional regulator [bacterium]|nr:sigma 54-interacting transcriptional regulator [bacterium]
MADLIVFHQGNPLLRESLERGLSIGRHRDNDVSLLDGVAPFHARLEVFDGNVVLAPKDGAVYLNGERLMASRALSDGDLFDLGGYRCQFFEATRSVLSPAADKTVTSSPESGKGSKRSLPVIHFLAPEKTRFRRSRLLIGRASSADLQIDNGYVSSQHAEIFFHDGEYRLRDLHSRNGTFLNDLRVTERVLPKEGTIRLGKLNVPYQIETGRDPVDIEIPGVTIPGIRAGEGDRMLVGSSKAFSALVEKLKKIAPTPDAVLLLGETGAGKDLIAQYLHAMNPKRKTQAFVPVNCAAIPQTLADSQLFGHVRGAFSGAVSDHKGFFQEANRGTLFLDEIGDLPMESQARLLRVIEDGYVRPVGGAREISLDVRLIFATNRDLDGNRSDGKFRDDLFQRFQWVVKIPPLRDRREDIPHLIRYFLQRHAPSPLKVGEETLAVLQRLPWPGNIRELNRAVRRAVTNAIGRGAETASLDDFEIETRPSLPANSDGETPRATELRQQKRRSLKETLKALNGNISHAAKALGVSRVTIHKWINEDDIDVERMKS